MNRISDEMIENAKNTSLTELAIKMGYTPKKTGTCFTLKEMDSIRIYNDRTWYRFSNKGNKIGGTTIDFLMEYSGMSFREAVYSLAASKDLRSEIKADEKPVKKETKEFVLPEKASDYRRVYAYLIQKRCLSKEVIDFFVKKRLIYEEKNHHNIVFVGTDSAGTPKYATLRGTQDLKKFRGDVYGSDKKYNFHLYNPESDELHVYESCIDMMSYIDMAHDYVNNHLALGMISDNPLMQFLHDHQHIKSICLHLDNDTPAVEAVYGNSEKNNQGFLKKYTSMGYAVRVDNIPKEAGKDVNDLLIFKKSKILNNKKMFLR